MAATTADVTPEEALSRPSSGAETARAKINLALHVVGRRPDGYHLLDSLVVFAAIGDTIEATPRDDGRIDLIVTGGFAADLSGTPEGDNLVIRAARALRKCLAGDLPGVSLRLTKRLPVAAGLGGGSADAAAVLRLLARLWQVDASREWLSEIGASLGADVPVCLLSRPARMAGTGDIVTPIAGLPSLPMVLVNPGTGISTRDVFAGLVEAEGSRLPPLPASFRSIEDVCGWLGETRNDLYLPARSLAPEIETVMAKLTGQTGCLLARMSGSGSTVFGLFSSAELARQSAERIRREAPAWWVAATESGGA